MNFEHPFYFLRHGETQWNKEGKTQGQLDIPLNDVGLAQAANAANALAAEPIERIISSPLKRARQTAEATAEKLGLDVSFDADLMECHVGDRQGEPHGSWLEDYWRGDYDPPNGETFGQFSARVWQAMQRAVALGPNTLIVAHGGLWIAAHEFVAVNPALRSMPNASPLHVTPEPGAWSHRLVG